MGVSKSHVSGTWIISGMNLHPRNDYDDVASYQIRACIHIWKKVYCNLLWEITRSSKTEMVLVSFK